MLSADDQERFSRHLLLDQFGGAGQETLLSGAVEIDLPARFAIAARSCARSLAAAGVGTLYLRGPWASEAHEECKRLAPRARIVSDQHEVTPKNAVRITELDLDGKDASAAELFGLGALAAVEAVKEIALGRSGGDRRSDSVSAPRPLALFPSAAATAIAAARDEKK